MTRKYLIKPTSPCSRAIECRCGLCGSAYWESPSAYLKSKKRTVALTAGRGLRSQKLLKRKKVDNGIVEEAVKIISVKVMSRCIFCGKETPRAGMKFCKNECYHSWTKGRKVPRRIEKKNKDYLDYANEWLEREKRKRNKRGF